MQSYGTAPPRIGTVAPGRGLIQTARREKKDPRVVQVKAHTRLKPNKEK